MTTIATTLNEGASPGEQAVCIRVAAQIGRRQSQRTDKGELLADLPEVNAGETTCHFGASKAGFSSTKTCRQAKSVVEQGAPNVVAATFSFAESTVRRWMNAAERCVAKSEVTSVLKRVVPLQMAEAITAFLGSRLDDAPPSPSRHQAHARTGQPADGESPAHERAEVIPLTPAPVPCQKEHTR